jgi:hypothetical protein
MSEEQKIESTEKALHIADVMHRFNPEYTWEYNLLQQVRWGEEDAKDDVCFYVKNWLEVIAKEEGYTLTKNGA